MAKLKGRGAPSWNTAGNPGDTYQNTISGVTYKCMGSTSYDAGDVKHHYNWIPLTAIEPLTITENGVYEVPKGVDGYNPVTVNVAGGSAGDSAAVLNVIKITSGTSDGENTYANERFILLDIYPKTNGTVNITYGSLTKSITDTSGEVSPESQRVFFGTFNGVTDDVETPDSGILTIDGEYRCYGQSVYTGDKSTTEYCKCVVGAESLGNIEYIPKYAFYDCDSNATFIFPASVRYIDDSAFARSYYSGANRTFVMLSTYPPHLGSTNSFGSKDHQSFVVPYGCINNYVGLDIPLWSSYANEITEAEA